MTKPRVGYHHEFFDDCNSLTDWSKTEVGLEATMSVEHDDYFHIVGTTNDTGADEYAYWTNNVADILVMSTTKALVRFKTGVASNGLQARIRFTFTAGDPKDVTLGFSQEWAVTEIDLSAEAGRTIATVLLFADDDPLSCPDDDYDVYFDFVVIYRGIFTFPNTQFGKRYVPAPRNATVPIPNRVTDIHQNLGSKSAEFRISCNLDIGRLSTTSATCTGDDWKRPQGVDAEYQLPTVGGDSVKAQVIDEISHASYAEPWVWLDTGIGRQFKAILDEEPVFTQTEEGDRHTVDLVFKEYSRCSKSNEDYTERLGLNL